MDLNVLRHMQVSLQRRGESREDAEDLIQDACERACREQNFFTRPRGTQRTWLWRNLYLARANRYRYNNRRRRIPSELCAGLDTIGDVPDQHSPVAWYELVSDIRAVIPAHHSRKDIEPMLRALLEPARNRTAAQASREHVAYLARWRRVCERVRRSLRRAGYQ